MMRKFVVIVVLLFGLMVTPLSARTVITLDELKEVETAGTYFVEIYTNDLQGNRVSKVVSVTVKFPRTVVSIGQGIDATDLRISKQMFDQMDEKSWIEQAKAHAWLIETGESIPVIQSRVESIGNGQFRVYFKTGSGVETFSFVQVVDQEVISDTLKPVFINPTTKEVFKQFNLQMLTGLFILILMPILFLLLIYFVFWKRIRAIYTLLTKKKTEN